MFNWFFLIVFFLKGGPLFLLGLCLRGGYIKHRSRPGWSQCSKGWCWRALIDLGWRLVAAWVMRFHVQVESDYISGRFELCPHSKCKLLFSPWESDSCQLCNCNLFWLLHNASSVVLCFEKRLIFSMFLIWFWTWTQDVFGKWNWSQSTCRKSSQGSRGSAGA